MSDAELLATEGIESKNGGYIFDRLPRWMPADQSTGNFKLLDVVGREFDKFEGDFRDVDNASKVQTAETVEQVEKLAKIVDLPPKGGESLAKYKSRTVAEFQTLTSEGTIGDILGNAATILEVRNNQITFKKLEENGVIQLGLPAGAVNELEITDNEFVAIIQKQSAAGYRIEATLEGTFTFISPTEYNGNEHDSTKGYDGLDSNGDPKDLGGTYAGIL